MPYTRITEFKYLTGQQHANTSVVYEFPQAEGDPYYPVPRAENRRCTGNIRNSRIECPACTLSGRLATYKYYNMDQIVAQALATVRRMMGRKRNEAVHTNVVAPAVSA